MDSLDISIRQLQDTFVSPLMSLGAAQTSSEWVWLNPAGFRNTIKLGKCKTENVSLFRFPLWCHSLRNTLVGKMLKTGIRLESKNHNLFLGVTHQIEGSDLPVVLGRAGNTQPSMDPSTQGKSLVPEAQHSLTLPPNPCWHLADLNPKISLGI